MNDKFNYLASLILGMLALILLIINIYMIKENQALQLDVNQRQTTINNGQNVSQFAQAFVRGLSDLAIKSDDRDIRALLATQGFNANDSSTPADTKPVPAK